MRASHNVKPISARLIKPERFTFPHVALVNFGPMWEMAQTNFDPEMRRNPDAIAGAVAATIPILNDLSARAANDLTLSSDMRNIHIAERSAGAVEAAEKGKGIVSRLVRHLWSWANVPDSEHVARREEASKTRQYLHNVHKNKTFRLEREAHHAARTKDRQFQINVNRWNAQISRDIFNTLDCADLPVWWPVNWHRPLGEGGGCVPIPVRNAHKRSGTGWAARNHKDSITGISHRREADGKPIPTAFEFRGDRSVKSPGSSVFDHSPTAARVAAHIRAEEVGEKFSHGITNESMELHEARADSIAELELPTDAEFEQMIPDDNDRENIVSSPLPRKKRIKPKQRAPFVAKALVIT